MRNPKSSSAILNGNRDSKLVLDPQTQEIKSLSIAPRDAIAQRVNSPEVCEENASADPDGAQHSFSQGGDSHGAQRRIESGRGDQPNEESPLPYNPR